MKKFKNIILIALMFCSIFGVVGVQSAPTELITNGTFEINTDGWTNALRASYEGDYRGVHIMSDINGLACNTSVNPDPSKVQTFNYELFGVVFPGSSTKYQYSSVEFRYSSGTIRQVVVIFLNAPDPGSTIYDGSLWGGATQYKLHSVSTSIKKIWIYGSDISCMSGKTLQEIHNEAMRLSSYGKDWGELTSVIIGFNGVGRYIYFDNVSILQTDASSCGDGTCNGTEDCASCVVDCGSCGITHTLDKTEGVIGDTITGSFYLESGGIKKIITSKSVKLNGVEVVADGDITTDGANTYSYSFTVPNGAISGNIIVYGTYGGTEYNDTQIFNVIPTSSGSNMYKIIADKDRIEVGQTVVLMLEHTTNGFSYTAETVTPQIQQLLNDAEIGSAFAPFVHDGSKYTATFQLSSKGKYTFTGDQIEYPVDIYVGINPSDYVEPSGTKCNTKVTIHLNGLVEGVADGVMTVSLRDGIGQIHSKQVNWDVQCGVTEPFCWIKQRANIMQPPVVEFNNVTSGMGTLSVSANIYGMPSRTVFQTYSLYQDVVIKCNNMGQYNIQEGQNDITNPTPPVAGTTLNCPQCQAEYKKTYPDGKEIDDISIVGLPSTITSYTHKVWCQSDEKEVSRGIFSGSVDRYTYQSPALVIQKYPECSNCFSCSNPAKPSDDTNASKSSDGNKDKLNPNINPNPVSPFDPNNPDYGKFGTLSISALDSKTTDIDQLHPSFAMVCANPYTCDNKYSLTAILYDSPVQGQTQKLTVCSCDANNPDKPLTLKNFDNVPAGSHRLELYWEDTSIYQVGTNWKDTVRVKEYPTFVYVNPNPEITKFHYDFADTPYKQNLSTLTVKLLNTSNYGSNTDSVKAKATKYSCGAIEINPEKCVSQKIIAEQTFEPNFSGTLSNNNIQWKNIIIEEGKWFFQVTVGENTRGYWYDITKTDFDRGYIELDMAKCLDNMKFHIYNSKETSEEKGLKHEYTIRVDSDRAVLNQDGSIVSGAIIKTITKENLFNADGEINYTLSKNDLCIYDRAWVGISVTREDGTQWIMSGVQLLNLYSSDATFEYDYGTGYFTCSGAGCGGVEVPPDDPNPPVVPVQEIKYYETWVKISVGDKCAIEKLQTHETEVDLWWTVNNATIHAPLFKNGQFYYKGQRVTETTLIDHLIITGMPIANYFVYNEYEQGGSVYLRYYNVGLPNGTINYNVKIDDYEKKGTFTIVEPTLKGTAHKIVIPCGATGDFWAKILAFLESNGYAILILAIVSLIAGILLSLVVGRSGILIGVLVFVIGVAFLWIAPSETITELNQYIKDFIGDL